LEKIKFKQMQGITENTFVVRPQSKFDVIPFVLHDRQAILDHALYCKPKLQIKGGTALSNPYKVHYDMAIAEKKLKLEIYTKSKLWAVRFTPATFKYLYCIPMAFGIGLCVYLHYVQIPRRIMYWKRQEKFDFPELEAKGTPP
jgi:hypothetical protein